MSIENFRQFCIPCKQPSVTFLQGNGGKKYVTCTTTCPTSNKIEMIEVTKDDVSDFENQIKND